jgi:hypothetical protein
MRKPEIPESKILTHEDMFTLGYGKFIRGMAAKKSMHSPAQDGAEKVAAVQAYINHGRWVIECPDCNGAQIASEEERRFWCLGCGNASVNFAWRHVRMPRERADIEAVLLRRPAARSDKAITRNWLPGETLRELEMENASHGVGINS